MEELIASAEKLMHAMARVKKVLNLLQHDEVEDSEQLSASCLELEKDIPILFVKEPLEKAIADCKDDLIKAALEKALKASEEFLEADKNYNGA